MTHRDEPAHVTPFLCEDADGVTLHFDLHAIQSRMQRDDPTALALEYTRVMMAFALLHPDPRHLLMIGLGGGSLAKYCHRHLPQVDLTVLEINPHVVALRQSFEVPPDGERFRVILGDGAGHVATLAQTVDVLLVDGFTYDGLPDELCSADFYASCRSALRSDGMLVANLPAEDERCAVWQDRIAAAFDGAVLALNCGDGGNRVMLAGAPCLGMSPAQLRQRLARHHSAEPRHRELLRWLVACLTDRLAAR